MKIGEKYLTYALDQVMLHCVARGCAAGGNLDFAIDRGEVVVDGTRTDHQLFGDLYIGQSLRH